MLEVRRKVDIDVFSPEEVRALVRAAASEQDGALFVAAPFTGMRRGELIALRWRDVDFAGSHIRVAGSYCAGALSAPQRRALRITPPSSGVRRFTWSRHVAGRGERRVRWVF